MEKLIGILRENGALLARLVRRNVTVDFESREAVASASQIGGWYEIVERPLGAIEQSFFVQRTPLLEAWEKLGYVKSFDPSSAAGLRLVISDTVQGKVSPNLLLPTVLTPETPEPTIAPTAAHPRAYRGTKYKPTKVKASVPTDLRASLCGTKHIAFLTEAEEAQRAAEARMPELFRTSLYPIVRRHAETEIGEVLALYWLLRLEHDPARLAAVAYLLSRQCSFNSLKWCRIVAALPEGEWTPLLHLLIMSGAYAVNVEELPASFAASLSEVLRGTDALYRTYWLLHGLPIGIAPEYLLAGYQIADAYAETYAFHSVQQSDYFPAAAVLQWGTHCSGDGDFYAGMLLRLWKQCGQQPGLGAHIETVDWLQFPPNVALRCLRLYAAAWDNWDELSAEQAGAKWLSVRPMLGELQALLQNTPGEFQFKCVGHLNEYLWQWDKPAELRDNLPAAIVLTRRLCRLPFGKRSDPTEVTTDFLAEVPGALRERFLIAPDSSFKRLEHACRRENDSRLISRGTYTLTRMLPEFSVRCFESYPVLLFKVAKLLGCLPRPVRDRIVAPFRDSALFATDFSALPPADAAALITAAIEPRFFNPIPATLREYLTGTRTLSPTALAQAVEQMGKQTLRAGLEQLEHATQRTLATGYDLQDDTEAVRHALQLERLAEENRRPLRKLLRAIWNAEPRYIQEHPKTRHWLAAHPNLNIDVWLQGITYQRELDDVGVVTLTIEQDPLEALKLGTYVGSCLGLGGQLSYSAAAAVLDINKRVTYARDARGVVLARQLLALTEDDRLVCFSIYPLAVKPKIASLFGEFDRLLSKALDLPLYDADADEGYDIANILSHRWWDDMAWDLEPN